MANDPNRLATGRNAKYNPHRRNVKETRRRTTRRSFMGIRLRVIATNACWCLGAAKCLALYLRAPSLGGSKLSNLEAQYGAYLLVREV